MADKVKPIADKQPHLARPINPGSPISPFPTRPGCSPSSSSSGSVSNQSGPTPRPSGLGSPGSTGSYPPPRPPKPSSSRPSSPGSSTGTHPSPRVSRPGSPGSSTGTPQTPRESRPGSPGSTGTHPSPGGSRPSSPGSTGTQPNPLGSRPGSSGTQPTSQGSKPGNSKSSSPASSSRTRPSPGGSGKGGGSPSVRSPPPIQIAPTGNLFPSGKVVTTGMATPSRSTTLSSGKLDYGHGSIMWPRGGIHGTASSSGGAAGDQVRRAMLSLDAEEVKRVGNEQYVRGNFTEALALYDRAVALSPANAVYRSNRAAVLTGIGRLGEAVRECEEAVSLDPWYVRAHQRLGYLLIRLGQVEVARKHLFVQGQHPDANELQKLIAVEKHLNRCVDARRVGDWKSTIREVDAAIAAGATHSPQLVTCKAESLLKLQQINEAASVLLTVPRIDPHPPCCSQSKFFGMYSEAYLFYVRAQIEMALGRFDIAVSCAEKAIQLDQVNTEVVALFSNVRLVARAHARGNDLFKQDRFTEACTAYNEGLRLDPLNSVLYCNRAACWFKLKMWEKSIEDCNNALRIQPNYNKALLRRASCYTKLERWAEAVRDYEVLRRELPNDNEVAESLFHAEVALKKTWGEQFYNMKFGGQLDEISSLEQFIAEISFPGVSVVHFRTASDPQCQLISPALDTLCMRHPSMNFLKVDVEKHPDVAEAQNVRVVPTLKIYKNGTRVKEIVNPTLDVIEASLRHYSF